MSGSLDQLLFMYPPEESEIFVGRDEEISKFLFNVNMVYTERKFRVIFIYGRKGVGKTMFIKEMISRVLKEDKVRVVYLDSVFVPDELKTFTLYVFERVIWWLFGSWIGFPNHALSMDEIKNIVGKMRETILRDFMKEKVDEFEQNYVEGDVQGALKNLLEIIERTAIDVKPIIIVFDNFHVLLSRDARSVKQFFELLKKIGAPLLLVISGLSATKMIEFARDARRFFETEIDTIQLRPFKREEAAKFAERIVKRVLPGKTLSILYTYTGGVPEYLYFLLKRATTLLSEMRSSWGSRDEEVLEKAFMAEALTSNGNIALSLEKFLSYLRLDDSPYFDVLHLVAVNEGASSSFISKSVGIEEGQLNKILKELIALEILQEKNGKVFYKDQLFRAFVYSRSLQYLLSVDALRNPKVVGYLKNLIEKLEATRYAKPSFKEWVVRVVNQLRGNTFSSLALGRANIASDITIGNRLIENWTEKIGEEQISVDILLANEELVVVEVKETERIRRDHIEEVLKKCENIELIERKIVKACWIISQVGIEESAINRALQETRRILILTDLKTINNIARKYGIEEWE